jgi:VCBS repeat-containing protein
MTSVSQATGLPPPVNQQTYTPPAYVAPAQTNNADAQKTILVSATTNLSLDQLITAKIETNPTLNQARTEAALIQNANTQAITQQAVVQNIARQLTISELIAVRNSVNGNYIFADTKVVQTIGGNTVTFYVPSIANVILNIPPSALPDTASVIETRLTPKTGSVLSNDVDPDNNPGPLRVLAYTSTNLAGLPGAIGSVVAGQFGSLSISSAGNYLYMVDTGKAQVYAPPPGSVVSDVFNYTISDAASNGSSTVTFSVDLSALTTRTGLTFSSTVVSTSTAATNSVGGDVTTTDKVVSGIFLTTALVTGVATEKNYTAGDEVISAGNKIVGDFGALILNPSGTYTYQIDHTKTLGIALGSFATDDFI